MRENLLFTEKCYQPVKTSKNAPFLLLSVNLLVVFVFLIIIILLLLLRTICYFSSIQYQFPKHLLHHPRNDVAEPPEAAILAAATAQPRLLEPPEESSSVAERRRWSGHRLEIRHGRVLHQRIPDRNLVPARRRRWRHRRPGRLQKVLQARVLGGGGGGLLDHHFDVWNLNSRRVESVLRRRPQRLRIGFRQRKILAPILKYGGFHGSGFEKLISLIFSEGRTCEIFSEKERDKEEEQKWIFLFIMDVEISFLSVCKL